jgi:hypothetical protein
MGEFGGEEYDRPSLVVSEIRTELPQMEVEKEEAMMEAIWDAICKTRGMYCEDIVSITVKKKEAKQKQKSGSPHYMWTLRVTFTSARKAKAALSNRRNINMDLRGIGYLNEDLTQEEQEVVNRKMPMMHKLRESGVKCQFRLTDIYINQTMKIDAQNKMVERGEWVKLDMPTAARGFANRAATTGFSMGSAANVSTAGAYVASVLRENGGPSTSTNGRGAASNQQVPTPVDSNGAGAMAGAGAVAGAGAGEGVGGGGPQKGGGAGGADKGKQGRGVKGT